MTYYPELARRLREHAEHHSVVAFMDGEQQQWMVDLRAAAQLARERAEGIEPTTSNWIDADDVQALAKLLDDAMNGEGAAERPALCDVVSQAVRHFRSCPPAAQPQSEPTEAQIEAATDAWQAHCGLLLLSREGARDEVLIVLRAALAAKDE